MIPQLPMYITEANAVSQIPRFESLVIRCRFVLSNGTEHANK